MLDFMFTHIYIYIYIIDTFYHSSNIHLLYWINVEKKPHDLPTTVNEKVSFPHLSCSGVRRTGSKCEGISKYPKIRLTVNQTTKRIPYYVNDDDGVLHAQCFQQDIIFDTLYWSIYLNQVAATHRRKIEGTRKFKCTYTSRSNIAP